MSPNKIDFREGFLEGVHRFNSRRFWDAHESWEELWLASESDLVQFLQGLIQLAAAYHHMQRGTFKGAVRLFEAALHKLEPFPERYCGIDRSDAVSAARRHREMALAGAGFADPEYPTLAILAENESAIPPVEKW